MAAIGLTLALRQSTEGTQITSSIPSIRVQSQYPVQLNKRCLLCVCASQELARAFYVAAWTYTSAFPRTVR